MTLSLGRFRAGPASPLEGVSSSAWQRLVVALEVQPIRAISESGGFGSFDMRPRRLVELELAVKLRTVRSASGRQIHTCEFVPPWTPERYLADPVTQYAVLCRSLSLHHKELLSGKIERPRGVSVAGALAILHRGGRGAIAGWPRLFRKTRELYEAARGAF